MTLGQVYRLGLYDTYLIVTLVENLNITEDTDRLKIAQRHAEAFSARPLLLFRSHACI